jgi:hypothetical protein
MSHRPALTASAVKIIHTTVQLLCLTSCQVLVIVVCVWIWFNMLLNSVYESYVKCGSARKCQRKFRSKFPGITFPSTTGIHKLIKKVRYTGSLLDKKSAKKNAVCSPKKN